MKTDKTDRTSVRFLKEKGILGQKKSMYELKLGRDRSLRNHILKISFSISLC